MDRHFWFGKWIGDDQLSERLDALPGLMDSVLTAPFPFDSMLEAADKLADDLAQDTAIKKLLLDKALETTARQDAEQMLEATAAMLRKEAMLQKLRSELGVSHPGIPCRRYPHRQFEAWYPVGCVVHVMPSNVFAVAALGLIEGLLVGNINIVKLSVRDSTFAALFAESLCTRDISGRLQNYMAVIRTSSADQNRMQALFAQADAISAWGGERAISAVRASAAEGTRVIAWGHKISFNYVAAECLDDAELRNKALDGAAKDVCRLDQQACSSPQTLFVEGGQAEAESFARDLAERLGHISPGIPGQLPDEAEQAEITTVLNVANAEESLGLTRVFEDKHSKRWRVILDKRPGLKPSPLFRTIFVKAIQRQNIVKTLRPMRTWLQTCGLACGLKSLAELSRAFLSAGVTRITRAGEMVDSYLGAPHDGVYALTQLARRVSIDGPPAAEGIGTITQLEGCMESAPTETPILKKKEFQARATAVKQAHLMFQSGGSSGQTVFSTFSWDDYHDQMRAAGHGLVAAGLDPARDCVMNLFFSGHMYGSFISFWSILESLRVRQVPMGMIQDQAEITDKILLTGSNVLIGLPSHLVPLLESNRTQLAGRIKKIFYGGERMTRAQYRFLTESCNVSVVRSAVYGSNDAGPMGYQCPYCKGTVHHLMTDLQTLEIVDMEEDIPVSEGEVGRLIFTSRARQYPEVTRYEIGDTGRWIGGKCACGRLDPRFELSGRTGDAFKAGGPFFNYRKFVNLLDEGLEYTGPVQVHVREEGNTILLELWLAEGHAITAEAAERVLREQYAELEISKEAALAFKFQVCLVPFERFKRVTASGKIKPVCDHRTEIA
ncbi:MAG: aldehyde dehydrogenase family protein [Thermodesulfobacteriota bacterium]